MIIDPQLYMNSTLVGWLLVLAILSGVVALWLFVIWSIELGDAHRNRLGGLVASILVLGLCAASLTFGLIGFNTNNDRWYEAADRAIQARYGLDLNRDQLGDLMYLDNTDVQVQGSTYVLLNSNSASVVDNATKVTLFHIGDRWLLGRGADQKRIDELPLAGR